MLSTVLFIEIEVSFSVGRLGDPLVDSFSILPGETLEVIALSRG
jgi:hypothetical protein